ncbi:DUF2332 family protein [Ciceribacter sp. L1K22]|uniref:DUF2332 domain-containing protein n=1 Tax=Ciceribacter sp. L1K22 TaxID=2820275 RepID=UPI001ABED467|nr:DUF2332 family protein [Ciceribacter sp. L1K22]MBO3762019.1 DUF2332 family protein [Ciceribacter sp. L1K22]
MTNEADIRVSFVRQAEACETLGSAFTGRLCRIAAHRMGQDSAVERVILEWQGNPTGTGDALALRLAGALHALVLSESDDGLAAVYPPETSSDEALWQACRNAFVLHESFILDRLKSAPQTNEVRRSSALLPAFLTIADRCDKPLVLSEVGASAGLNLRWDRYAYRLGDFAWGNDSSVVLAPDWEGKPPPRAQVSVAGRAGCDLNPLDPASPDDCLRLTSYIWADQQDRLDRTRAALAIARQDGLKVERADAVDWLESRLRRDHAGQCHVVYHTIAWQYLPAELKQKGEALIAAAGARATERAPLARLQVEADGEPDGASISLQLWPTGEKHEIGRADFHGRWIKWKGWPT